MHPPVHAVASRRGRPRRRWSCGAGRTTTYVVPAALWTSKDTASDGCHMKLKLSGPSIRGISGGKWPSLRWLSPNCIVCPTAGIVLTAERRMCATVGGALSETVAMVSLRTEKMLSMFRLGNKKRPETGPNRRCSGPEQYQKLFRYDL